MVFETSLSADEATRRLAAITRSPDAPFAAGDERTRALFTGHIEARSFVIRRRIDYTNPFLPNVEGTLVPSKSGTRLRFSVGLRPLVGALFVAWIVVCAVAAKPLIAVVGDAGLGFLLAGIALPTMVALIGFLPEALKAKRLLEETLEP